MVSLNESFQRRRDSCCRREMAIVSEYLTILAAVTKLELTPGVVWLYILIGDVLKMAWIPKCGELGTVLKYLDTILFIVVFRACCDDHADVEVVHPMVCGACTADDPCSHGVIGQGSPAL